METLKSTGGRTLQTKYQAIVFQKQNRSNIQEFHTEDIRIRTPLPTVLSILLFRSSYVIVDLWRPRHSPAGSNFTAGLFCFHRLKALGRMLRLSLVSTRHTTCWGFPPCSCVGVLKLFGLDDIGFTVLPYIVAIWAQSAVKKIDWLNGMVEARLTDDGIVCVFPPALWWHKHMVNHLMCQGAGNPNADGNTVSEREWLVAHWVLYERTCLDKPRNSKKLGHWE